MPLECWQRAVLESPLAAEMSTGWLLRAVSTASSSEHKHECAWCNRAKVAQTRWDVVYLRGWGCLTTGPGVDWSAVEEFVDLRGRLSEFAVFPKTKEERK